MTSSVAPISPEISSYGEISSVHESQMSRVFLVDGQFPVVIKELKDDATEFSRASLIREPKIMGELDHPQIPVLIEDKTDEERPFFVMAREPASLDYRIFYDEPDAELAANIVLSALKPLRYMHREKFIHRDVKPEHFAVVGSGRAALLDYGLALPEPYSGRIERGEIKEGSEEHLRARNHHFRFTSSLWDLKSAGTPDYMSPEQARGDEADKRSDIYTMGISFYELLYGKRPFSSGRPSRRLVDYKEWVEDDVVDTVLLAVNGASNNGNSPRTPPHTISSRHLYQDIDYSSSQERVIPAELVAVVERATQREPEDRYQTADEMHEEIERYLRDQNRLAVA